MANPEAPRSPDGASPSNPLITRRRVLGGMAGVAGLAAVPSLIAACSPAASTAPSASTAARTVRGGERRRWRVASAAAAAAGTVSIGSYHSDPGEPEGMAADQRARSRRRPASTCKMNTVDHSTFQNQITNYLRRHAGDRLHVVLRIPHEVLRGQGPERSRSTTSGPRSRTTTPRASPSRSSATTARSTAFPSTTTRGRSSTGRASWPRRATRSRRPGTTSRPWPRRCRRDGLTPIAFADQEGWPAMGTFDILNLRLNGYDFHVGLMAGDGEVDGPEGHRRLPEVERDPPVPRQGLRRPEVDRRGEHPDPEEVGDVPARPVRLRRVQRDEEPGRPRRPRLLRRSRPWARSTTPRRPSTPRSTRGRSRPSRRTSRPRPTRQGVPRVLGARARPRTSSSSISRASCPTAKDADTSTYTALQKKAVEIVSKATRITQFLDRDTRAGLRRTRTACRASCRRSSPSPTQDLAAYQKTIQDFWDQLPPL